MKFGFAIFAVILALVPLAMAGDVVILDDYCRDGSGLSQGLPVYTNDWSSRSCAAANLINDANSVIAYSFAYSPNPSNSRDIDAHCYTSATQNYYCDQDCLNYFAPNWNWWCCGFSYTLSGEGRYTSDGTCVESGAYSFGTGRSGQPEAHGHYNVDGLPCWNNVAEHIDGQPRDGFAQEEMCNNCVDATLNSGRIQTCSIPDSGYCAIKKEGSQSDAYSWPYCTSINSDKKILYVMTWNGCAVSGCQTYTFYVFEGSIAGKYLFGSYTGTNTEMDFADLGAIAHSCLDLSRARGNDITSVTNNLIYAGWGALFNSAVVYPNLETTNTAMCSQFYSLKP